MNQTKRDIIIKLETINKIPKGGKLNLVNNEIEIYKNNWYEWIKRTMSKDGRNNTINYLYNFYDHILLISNELMENNNAKNKIVDLISISVSLINSLIGIYNLRFTYLKDEKVGSQLTFIGTHYIIAQFNKINEYINANDSDIDIYKKLNTEIKELILNF
jgi:hypothetical protein